MKDGSTDLRKRDLRREGEGGGEAEPGPEAAEGRGGGLREAVGWVHSVSGRRRLHHLFFFFF